ncbi:hypothetical protein H9P43_006307 [Blastocladiella emersonii ATCC 22665]|nr:hypothetical protein H9P43_006307 [Blastocladiella emersonii ATCC 22665]
MDKPTTPAHLEAADRGGSNMSWCCTVPTFVCRAVVIGLCLVVTVLIGVVLALGRPAVAGTVCETTARVVMSESGSVNIASLIASGPASIEVLDQNYGKIVFQTNADASSAAVSYRVQHFAPSTPDPLPARPRAEIINGRWILYPHGSPSLTVVRDVCVTMITTVTVPQVFSANVSLVAATTNANVELFTFTAAPVWDAAKIQTANGNIGGRINAVRQANVTTENGNSEIVVAAAHRVALQADNGNMEVSLEAPPKSAEVTARSGNGNVQVAVPNVADGQWAWSVQTSTGNIEVDGNKVRHDGDSGKAEGKLGKGDVADPSPSLTCVTLALNHATGDTYHPFGRTYARDLFFYHNPRVHRRLDALVFQCGDLRDVARTIGDSKRKYGRGCDLAFVLSDTRPETIAHNLLVLHAVANFDGSDKSTFARHIGQLFYSSLLEPDTHRFWTTRIGSCLDANFTDEDAQVRVLDEDSMRAVRNCWESWLACDWTPEQLAKERSNYFSRTQGVDVGRDHFQSAVNRFMDLARSTHGGDLPVGTHAPALEREVRALLAEGACLFAKELKTDADRSDLVVNPTLLLAGFHRKLSFSAPFAFSPLNVFQVDIDDIRGSMLRELGEYVGLLIEAFGPGSDRRRDSGTKTTVAQWGDHPPAAPFLCRIAFIAGHPVTVMERLVSHAQLSHPPSASGSNLLPQQRLQPDPKQL